MMITLEQPAQTSAGPAHCFSHHAMAAPFEIRMDHPDGAYAAQAARDAFAVLDRLEMELSRYDGNSDISRLNALRCGEVVVLGEAAFTCLVDARRLEALSGGAFDITAGVLKDLWQTERPWWRRCLPRKRQVTGMRHIHLEEGWRVWKDAPVQIDPGAIGKGFAVDRMVERLLEWQIGDFLVHGGASSVAVRGDAPGRRGWPVTLRHPRRPETILERLDLRDQAMGASGLQKGAHIIDPRTKRPARGRVAVWVRSGDATTADALSTALMVAGRKEAQHMIAGLDGVGAWVIYGQKEAGEVLRLGRE